MNPQVLAVGDNCVDVYVDRGLGFPGGGPVNTAVYLARLGVAVAYAGAVGDDASGRLITDSLNQEGVDTSLVQVYPEHTNLAFVRHQDNDRVFLGVKRGARAKFRWQQIPTGLLNRVQVVQTTLDGMVNDFLPHIPRSTAQVIYDFSNRYGPEHQALLPFIDIAFASTSELAEADAIVLGRRLLELGAKTAVLTRGEQGSLALQGDQIFRCGIRTVAVTDTLGCGDAFIAGYIGGLLSEKHIQACLELGRDTAAEAIGVLGGYGYGQALQNLDLENEMPV